MNTNKCRKIHRCYCNHWLRFKGRILIPPNIISEYWFPEIAMLCLSSSLSSQITELSWSFLSLLACDVSNSQSLPLSQEGDLGETRLLRISPLLKRGLGRWWRAGVGFTGPQRHLCVTAGLSSDTAHRITSVFRMVAGVPAITSMFQAPRRR